MDPVLIGVISACTALVASIIGPIVTLTVAKRQFNATVLSANRQDGSKHCGTWLPNLSRSWLPPWSSNPSGRTNGTKDVVRSTQSPHCWRSSNGSFFAIEDPTPYQSY